MREERIELSQREQDRLKVLHQVEQGYLTQVEAGRRVQVSVRHLRRLLRRVRAEGDRGVVHRLRGQPSLVVHPGPGAAALRRLWAHAGQRAPGARWVAGQPGDAAAVDDRRRAVAVAPAAEAGGARLARARGPPSASW